MLEFMLQQTSYFVIEYQNILTLSYYIYICNVSFAICAVPLEGKNVSDGRIDQCPVAQQSAPVAPLPSAFEELDSTRGSRGQC